jgi:hypothetical protein
MSSATKMLLRLAAIPYCITFAMEKKKVVEFALWL